MLGWILLGLVTAAAGVIVISGIVDKSRIKEKMRERNMRIAIIKEVDSCTNTVKLEDLDSEETLEIRGDDLDDDLSLYDPIIA